MKKLFFILFILYSCVALSQRSDYFGALGTVIPNASGGGSKVFDDTSSYTNHSILNSEISDNAYQCENCGTIYAPYYSTLSRLIFTTKSRFIKIKCYSNNSGFSNGDGVLGITVNGVTDSVHFPVNDVYKTIDLGKEDTTKTVEIVNGTAIIFAGSTVMGSYITGLEFPTNRSISIQTTSRPTLIVGNSIIAGFGTPEPVIYGVVTVLRNIYGHDIAYEGFSAQALYYLTTDQTKFEDFITRVVRYNPRSIYWELGTNDWGLVAGGGLWAAVSYQVMLGRVADTLHTLMPTVHIYVQSPLYRSNESGANGRGEYLSQFRTADSTVCLTRGSYTSYVNGLPLLVFADLNNNVITGDVGLHPHAMGVLKYAHIIDSLVTW